MASISRASSPGCRRDAHQALERPAEGFLRLVADRPGDGRHLGGARKYRKFKKPFYCWPFRSATPAPLWSAIISFPHCARASRLPPYGCMRYTGLDIRPRSRDNMGQRSPGFRGLHHNAERLRPTAPYPPTAIHDRDAIFSKAVVQSVRHMGLHVINTPVRTPVANAICERVRGTLRRECLDFVIPLNEKHLNGILKEWVGHYNQGRPHMSLGPGIPGAIRTLPVPRQVHRHRLPHGQSVVDRPILGGLHHDYGLKKRAA
jgi:transposase InsO family protein